MNPNLISVLNENNSFTVNGTTFSEIPITIDGFNLDPSVVNLTNINVDTLVFRDIVVDERFITNSFPNYKDLSANLKSILLVHLKTLSTYQVNLFIATLRYQN